MKDIKLLDTLEENKIIELGRGKVISKIEMNNNKGCFPVYSSAATGNGKFGEYGKYMFDDERITWSIDGGGKFFYREKHKYSVTNVCGWIKINNPAMLNTKYVYYNLLNQWKYLSFDYVSKAPPSKIKKVYSINIINLDKQKKIVNDLDRIQQKIDINNDILSNINELIKSQFINMFGDLNTTKFPIKTLEEITEFIKDGTHNTPDYTNDTKKGFKFLSSKDVTSEKINWNNIKYIPASLHKELIKRVQPQKNDILLAKNGTYGVCAVVDTDDVFDIYVSLALIRLHNNVNPYYMWAAINNPMSKEQFDSKIKGIGVPNLHLCEIKKTRVIVPPISKQKEFAKFVNHIDKLKFIVQQRIDLLNELLNTKMHEYFDEE